MNWLKSLATPFAILVEAIASAMLKIREERKRREEHKKKSEEFDEALKKGDSDAIRKHLDDLVRK